MWADKIGPMVKTSLAGGKNLAHDILGRVGGGKMQRAAAFAAEGGVNRLRFGQLEQALHVQLQK